MLAIVPYLNTLHHPFVFDDKTEILENPSIRDITDTGGILRYNVTRPLVNVSYALDFAGSRLNPFGYHVTNVGLHTLNVLLVFLVVRRLWNGLSASQGSADPVVAAGVVASLFAVHPVMTEAVGYISGRAELLCSTFFLSSFLALTRSLVDSSRAWALAGVLLLVLALASKEQAVILPILLLAYDVLRSGPRSVRTLRWRLHLPLLGGVLLLGVARVALYMRIEHPETAAFGWQYLPVQVVVLARYIGLLILPSQQSIVHPVEMVNSLLDVRLLVAGGVVMLLVGEAIRCRRRSPLVTFGIIWFLTVQAPAAALMLLADRGQPMAEHRIYLASIGFFAAATASVAGLVMPVVRFPRHRLVLATALSAAVLALATATVARNRVWSDPIRLWEDAARKAPNTFITAYGVADAYLSVGDCPSAVPAYRRAQTLRPDDPRPVLGLAACLQEEREGSAAARQVLRAAAARMPNDVQVRLALATLEEQARNPGESLRLCREVLSLAPGRRDAADCVVRSERALARQR